MIVTYHAAAGYIRRRQFGSAAYSALQRPEPQLDPAADRAGAGVFLWPDEGDQHDPRRADHDRGLHHLSDEWTVNPLVWAGRREQLFSAGAADILPCHGASGTAARSDRDSLPIWPPARYATGDLGRGPGVAAGCAEYLRCAKCSGHQPALAEWCAGAGPWPAAALQAAVYYRAGTR